MKTHIEAPIKTYFVIRDGTEYGPYSAEKLREGVVQGRLSKSNNILAEGLESPIPLGSVILELGTPPLYATTVSRCLAYLIDLTIYMVALPLIIVPPAIVDYFRQSDFTAFLLSLSVWSNTLIFYALTLYFTCTISSGRAGTIGMQVLKIKAVTIDCKPVGFLRSFCNWLIFYLTGTVSFLSQPFTERRQGIQDIITGVIVIRK